MASTRSGSGYPGQRQRVADALRPGTVARWIAVLLVAIALTYGAEIFWIEESAPTEAKFLWLVRGALVGLAALASIALVMAEATEQAEARASASAAAFDSIVTVLDGLPVAAFVVDRKGRPLFSNRASRRLLGQGTEDVTFDDLGRAYAAYVRGTNEIYPASKMPLARALAGEEHAEADDMELERNGERIPIRVWASPVRDSEGIIRMAIAGFVRVDGAGL